MADRDAPKFVRLRFQVERAVPCALLTNVGEAE